MKKNLRVKSSKFIDETYKISFKFNKKTYYGYKGDTLASALLANIQLEEVLNIIDLEE